MNRLYLFDKYLLILSILLLTSDVGAQICNFNGKAILEEGATGTNIINGGTAFSYIDDVLKIDNKAQLVVSMDTYTYGSKTNLIELVNCQFSANKDFRENISGTLIAFELDESANQNGIQKLDYFSFTDYGRTFHFVLLNKAHLFEFINTIDFVWQPAIYYEYSTIEEQVYQYVETHQIGGNFELIKEAEYEDVTEQVIVKEGYNELTVVPPIFKRSYHQIYNESSTCPDAVVDTIEMTYTAQDGYEILEIVAPQFEVITEQVITEHAFYGPDYFKRTKIDLDSIKQVYTSKIIIDSIIPDCYNINFLRCAAYSEIKDSTIESAGIGVVYQPCPDNYYSAGEYCYNENIEVDNTYGFRQYTKLDVPSSVISTSIDPEEAQYTLTRITNANDLPAGCVSTAYDSIPYDKLISPTTINDQYIPAEYGTVSSRIIQSYPEFTAIPSEEIIDTITTVGVDNIIKINDHLKLQTVDIPCMHESILSRLISLGYNLEADDVFSLAYYQAIVEYQSDHKLAIGAINDTFLESLNISFE